MSIQLAIAKKLHNRILDKSGIAQKINLLSIYGQKILRNFSKDQLPVYYHYYGKYTHPHIRERMYGAFAPVRWKNYSSANLAHFLQKPESVEKPYLIEPNDHILTLGAMFGSARPSDLIKRIPDMKEIIASTRFKGFLLGPDGLSEQFKYYFGDEYLSKIWIYPQARALPKFRFFDFSKENNEKPLSELRFICLAGDYKIKAIDLLIDAWLSIESLSGATLTIACPNVPEETLRRVSQVGSIKLVTRAPLSKRLKSRLLGESHVSIGLTHIDGGANLVEGMEYGHAVITNTNHRSTFFDVSKNGFVVRFPNEYYRPGQFGIAYDSWREYLELVDRDQALGKYDQSKAEIAQAITSYIKQPELLRQHVQNTMLSIAEQTVWKSNEALLEIYKRVINN